jgi:SAM-dependent methyltransferase
MEYKLKQATFFDDEVDESFEITRPHGTPRTYRWLLGEKFRQSLSRIRDGVPGALTLCVCGGSGMDSEFLVRAGARVISSDISHKAVKRARERAIRYNFPLITLIADVENLPFDNSSIDLVYVHDGLHHLDQPVIGLCEMARVAKLAVSITEPARATFTRIAVFVGIAQEIEEAGNIVRRLDKSSTVMSLVENGFSILHAQRYAMYYKHEPGLISKVLSLPGIFQLYKVGYRIVNYLIGRFGNKLVVTAVRSSPETIQKSDVLIGKRK